MAISMTSGGIVFPASFSNTADANTLDDYEEAEVSDPTMRGSGNSIQASRTQNNIVYVKMGKGFIGQWECHVSSHNSGTGTGEVSLPFSSQDYGAHGIRTYQGSFNTAYRQAMAIHANSSWMQFQEYRSGTTPGNWQPTGYIFAGFTMIVPYSSPYI
jgi:hypothetical protein